MKNQTKVSFEKKIFSVFFLLLFVVAMMLLMTITASANDVTVLFTSQIPDNEDVKLKEDTVIYVDTPRVLSSITGDYNLTIRGEENLIINARNFSAIDVNSLSVSTNLTATSTSDRVFCIDAYEGFTFNGSALSVKGHGGIYCESGDVILNSGDIEIFGNGREAIRTQGKLVADVRTILLSCRMEEDAEKWHQSGAYAIAGMNIKANNIVLAGRNAAVSQHGDICLEGNTMALATEDAIVNYYGSVVLRKTAKITSGETYTGIICEEDISFEGFNLVIEGGRGIVSEKGNITLADTVTVKVNGDHAIRAAGKITMNDGHYKIYGSDNQHSAIYGTGGLEMAPVLDVVLPHQGYADDHTVRDQDGYAAHDLEICRAITDVDVYIGSPIGGYLPPEGDDAFYGLDEDMTVKFIIWYEDGVRMNAGDRFICGKSYTADIRFVTKNGAFFHLDSMAKVNGKSLNTYSYNGQTEIEVNVSFGKCPDLVGQVDLDIKAPAEGATASLSVSYFGSGYGVHQNSENIRWMVSTDGKNYVSMTAGEKFVAGKYYKVFIDVQTSADNYKFVTDTSGSSVQPRIAATVNGAKAQVTKAYDQDPQTIVTVSYDFGKCNDTVIEEIIITGVVAPVVGEHPSYTCTILGSGYHINTEKNASYDAWWATPPTQWPYIKNGIGWFDLTKGDWVYAHETFIAGHEYQVNVYLVTDDGYTFAHDRYYEMLFTVTVNGQAAEGNTSGSNGLYNQTIMSSFLCPKKEITSIIIHDLEAPKAGETPDTAVSPAYPEFYAVDSVTWYNADYLPLEPGEVFVAREVYCVEIKVVPGSLGASATTFNQSLTAYVNGQEVISYGMGGWDKVEVRAGAIYIRYTFKNPAAAPEVAVESNISGIITAGRVNVKPEVLLYAADDTAFASPLYTATVSDGFTVSPDHYWNYSFEGVALGDYVLVIKKVGHETYTTQITATVGHVFVEDLSLVMLPCEHEGGKATCTDLAVCLLCGEGYGELDPENHASDDTAWERTDNYHTEYYVCCGAEIISDEFHMWANGSCTVCGYDCDHVPGDAADCENDQGCILCGFVLVPMLGHDYTTIVTAPTCTDNGYTTYTCNRCKYTYDGDVVEAEGHRPGDPADCYNDQGCVLCGAILADKLGHDYKSEVTAPTCTDKGYTTFTCTRCGDSYVGDEVAPKGHTPGAAATCTANQTCTVCGTVVAGKLGHDYKAEVTAPTCTDKGYTTHTCARCNDSYTDTEVAAKGHTPGDWIVDKEPAAGVEGSKHKECMACGKTLETAVMEALPTETEAETELETELRTEPETEAKTEMPAELPTEPDTDPPAESQTVLADDTTANTENAPGKKGCSGNMGGYASLLLLMLATVPVIFKRPKEHV